MPMNWDFLLSHTVRKRIQLQRWLHSLYVEHSSHSPLTLKIPTKNGSKEEEEEEKVPTNNIAFNHFLSRSAYGICGRFKIAFNDFMNWYLWSLLDDAKENPNDSAKQTTALPVELNLHSAESVIKQFRERETAVDCRGVVEYLRALVTTNAIAEYLPDEESGKPCSLHTLLQELKQCASCNTDESILSPGISEPTMNVKTFKDVKGCDDAKQELEEVVEYLRNPAKFTRLMLNSGVTICGMSDAIGPVYIQQPPSYAMQSRIDAEVDKLLREAYDRVKALLKKHEKALHALADALLFYETLNAEEIRRILLPYQQEQQKHQKRSSCQPELLATLVDC